MYKTSGDPADRKAQLWAPLVISPLIFFKYLYKSRRETKRYGLDTYAVHGGNLISIELHTLTHRERHEEKEEENKACSQRGGGGEKVKDMLVHARKKAEDTLCREMRHFQHICDSISQQQHAAHFPEMISPTVWKWTDLITLPRNLTFMSSYDDFVG